MTRYLLKSLLLAFLCVTGCVGWVEDLSQYSSSSDGGAPDLQKASPIHLSFDNKSKCALTSSKSGVPPVKFNLMASAAGIQLVAGKCGEQYGTSYQAVTCDFSPADLQQDNWNDTGYYLVEIETETLLPHVECFSEGDLNTTAKITLSLENVDAQTPLVLAFGEPSFSGDGLDEAPVQQSYSLLWHPGGFATASGMNVQFEASISCPEFGCEQTSVPVWTVSSVTLTPIPPLRLQ